MKCKPSFLGKGRRKTNIKMLNCCLLNSHSVYKELLLYSHLFITQFIAEDFDIKLQHGSLWHDFKYKMLKDGPKNFCF